MFHYKRTTGKSRYVAQAQRVGYNLWLFEEEQLQKLAVTFCNTSSRDQQQEKQDCNSQKGKKKRILRDKVKSFFCLKMLKLKI